MAAAIDFLVRNDLLWAIVIFLTSIALAEILNILVRSIIALFTSRTKTLLDDDLAAAIKKPLFFGIILIGLHYSLLSIDMLLPFSKAITKITTIAGILITYLLVERIVKALVRWYSIELYPRIRNGGEHKNLTIFRRVFDIVLFVIFLLIILRYLGVEITPIIASLGIGGLAVALALQQTLGDFIAGLSIIGDKSLKIGDYVELDSGLGGSPLGGYIEDISWRTSRIRTLSNNYCPVCRHRLQLRHP
jgi:MscS family membrane protein